MYFACGGCSDRTKRNTSAFMTFSIGVILAVKDAGSTQLNAVTAHRNM